MFLKDIADRLRNIINSIINSYVAPYWVEITTSDPGCLYYFGPFRNYAEASEMQQGYVEDLVAEQATGIVVNIKRCLPTQLTVTELGEPS